MMKNGVLFSSLVVVGAVSMSTPACAQESRPEVSDAAVKAQVTAALLAAPAERRDAATVMAYRDGKLYRARAGKGDLICLADDPGKSGFQASCYHRDLEPYMARGRALRAQGVKGQANRETRWKEVEEGKLALPKEPRALYVLHGEGFDADKGEVTKAYLRWVIFTPFATPESTGLSLAPAPGAPWLMYPGTAGAHIMISPPKPSDKAAAKASPKP